jgi:hypothetical protein
MGSETRFDGPAEVIRTAVSGPLHGKIEFDSVVSPHRTAASGGFTEQTGYLLFRFCSYLGRRGSLGSAGTAVRSLPHPFTRAGTPQPDLGRPAGRLAFMKVVLRGRP